MLFIYWQCTIDENIHVAKICQGTTIHALLIRSLNLEMVVMARMFLAQSRVVSDHSLELVACLCGLYNHSSGAWLPSRIASWALRQRELAALAFHKMNGLALVVLRPLWSVFKGFGLEVHGFVLVQVAIENSPTNVRAVVLHLLYFPIDLLVHVVNLPAIG